MGKTSLMVRILDRVIKSSTPIELEQELKFKLHSMGLVNLQGDLVVPSRELYRQYFRDRLRSS